MGDSIIQTFIINSSNFNLTKVGLVNEVVYRTNNHISEGNAYIVSIHNINAIIFVYSVNTIIE